MGAEQSMEATYAVVALFEVLVRCFRFAAQFGAFALHCIAVPLGRMIVHRGAMIAHHLLGLKWENLENMRVLPKCKQNVRGVKAD